jgi:TolA-binding protein
MQMEFKDVAQIIGYTTTVFTGVALVAGIFWYVFRGKSQEQLKDSVAEWKDVAEANKEKIQILQSEIAEMKAEMAQMRLKLERAETHAEELRKANLRLQGILNQ